MSRSIIQLILSILALIPILCIAQSDRPGGRDHSKIPRVDGTWIIGHSFSNYDEGIFQTGKAGKELITTSVEGKRTRIIYAGTKNLSPLQIVRNYEKALKDIGDVEVVYSCKKTDCFKNLGRAFIWRKNNQLEITGANYQYMYHVPSKYRDQIYWYGKVTSPDAEYHVSVYTAVQTSRGAKEYENLPLVHIEIIESSEFEPTLKFVKAEEMSSTISAKGHVALYGIYFDFDSDRLKAESNESLGEIKKLLSSNPELNLYVVGHTDGVGKDQYNLDLSKRRAHSVVQALTSRFDIAKIRLIAHGAGPYSPVASNGSDGGRAKNRRVELVERYIEKPKPIPQATLTNTGAVSTGDDIKTRLMRLKSLKDKGLIDESEYNHKRKEILESL